MWEPWSHCGSSHCSSNSKHPEMNLETFWADILRSVCCFFDHFPGIIFCFLTFKRSPNPLFSSHFAHSDWTSVSLLVGWSKISHGMNFQVCFMDRLSNLQSLYAPSLGLAGDVVTSPSLCLLSINITLKSQSPVYQPLTNCTLPAVLKLFPESCRISTYKKGVLSCVQTLKW